MKGSSLPVVFSSLMMWRGRVSFFKASCFVGLSNKSSLPRKYSFLKAEWSGFLINYLKIYPSEDTIHPCKVRKPFDFISIIQSL